MEEGLRAKDDYLYAKYCECSEETGVSNLLSIIVAEYAHRNIQNQKDKQQDKKKREC